MASQADLRTKAQSVAIEAWDSFEVRWISDPVQPRLAAAVDAAAEVYEGQLNDRGDFGREATFRGGPLDGQKRKVAQLEGHLVISDADGTYFARPQVYRLDFQMMRYEHLGHVCPGDEAK